MSKQTVLKLETIKRSPEQFHKAVLFGILGVLVSGQQVGSHGR